MNTDAPRNAHLSETHDPEHCASQAGPRLGGRSSTQTCRGRTPAAAMICDR